MRGRSIIAAAAIGSCVIGPAVAADSSGRPQPDQSTPPTAPPSSGATGSELGRSGGVITPPAGVDPQMRRLPPASGDRMPVIPPPERQAVTHRSNQNSASLCRAGRLLIIRFAGRHPDRLSSALKVAGCER